jgi:hypothetical protein
VVDSNFVEAYLVDKIGNRIQEHYRLLSAAWTQLRDWFTQHNRSSAYGGSFLLDLQIS